MISYIKEYFYVAKAYNICKQNGFKYNFEIILAVINPSSTEIQRRKSYNLVFNTFYKQEAILFLLSIINKKHLLEFEKVLFDYKLDKLIEKPTLPEIVAMRKLNQL